MSEQTLLEARNIIAGFLKNRRVELGISQADLAERTGMNIKTITRMEKARFWPGSKQLILICDALDIDIMKIFS